MSRNNSSGALVAHLLAPLTLFVPSTIGRANLAKLATLGAILATLFLFTGRIWLPGGAGQFVDYANAIIHDAVLQPSVAQRDAGYPLIIILSGYLALNSLIPLLLIQAAFAIVSPLLIYEALQRLSIRIAFLTGLAAILTLSPYYFMKMIHHDQTYIFFSTLMLCILLILVQTKQIRFLYFFTVAAICASIVRPAGNILFPIFLVVSYPTVRGQVRHYFLCAAIFFVGLAAYSWHRYVIFDMKDVGENASYTGAQIFYDPYVNSFDYKIHLEPARIGPSFRFAVDQLRQKLAPDPKDSQVIRRIYDNSPRALEFSRANMYPFSTDQLIDKVLTSSNYEYYSLLCDANDDQTMLRAAWEISRAYPWLILSYSFRNLVHFIFNPGFTHARYTFEQFGPAGLIFWPALREVDPGELAKLRPRAVREATFDPLSRQPVFVQKVFYRLERAWLGRYLESVTIMAGFMTIAGATAIAVLAFDFIGFIGRRTGVAKSVFDERWAPVFYGGLTASIIMASLVFGYNAAVTSIFAEPDFRYRQMADLQAILLGGLGLVALYRWLSVAFSDGIILPLAQRWNALTRWLSAIDIWEQRSKPQLAMLVIGLTAAAFASWAVWMVTNTAI